MRPVARFLRDINFPFRGNSNQFTIHAASMYTQPRAVVIRAANQKLSSEQPTGWPSMQQAETSTLYSLKRGWMVGKYTRKGYTRGESRMGGEIVRNVSDACWQFRLLTFYQVSVVLRIHMFKCIQRCILNRAYRPGEEREEYLTRPLSYKSNYRQLTILTCTAIVLALAGCSCKSYGIDRADRIDCGENHESGTPLIEIKLVFDFAQLHQTVTV